MIEDDRRIGKRPGEVGEVGDVRVIDPALERQSVRPEMGVSSPEVCLQQHMLRKVGRLVGRHGGIRPRRTMADAPKALRARRDLRFEHRRHPVTQPEVGGADDARRHPRLTVSATRAHRRDALHEFRLADHPELFRTVGTIHRRALDKHCLTHVVRTDILDELLEEVPVAGSIPQMVMRIDDRKIRLESRFVCPRQPRLGRDASPGGLPGPRALRRETVEGAGADETTQRIRPCALKEAPSRDVIHTLQPHLPFLPSSASAQTSIHNHDDMTAMTRYPCSFNLEVP